MKVSVRLFSMLREKLPPAAKGKAELDLPEGSTLADLLARLEITVLVNCAVNGKVVRDPAHVLEDGDEVQVFRPSGGGR
jgi:sulfur carrier protein ThiS